MEDNKGGPRPVVTFFQPRTNQELVLFSLFEREEVALQKFLPKSRVPNVIIRDNNSVQRMQGIKLRDLDNSQRKTGNYYEHMKKKFLQDQQNKMNQWKKQYSRYQRMLERIDQRAMQEDTKYSVLLYSQKLAIPLQLPIPKKTMNA